MVKSSSFWIHHFDISFRSMTNIISLHRWRPLPSLTLVPTCMFPKITRPVPTSKVRPPDMYSQTINNSINCMRSHTDCVNLFMPFVWLVFDSESLHSIDGLVPENRSRTVYPQRLGIEYEEYCTNRVSFHL